MRIPLLLALLAAAALADERVDNIFRVWDADGDDILEPTEVPDAGIFRRIDTDGNGQVTRAEVAAYLSGAPKEDLPKKRPAETDGEPKSKTDAGPRRAPRTLAERVADFFRRFDADEDGKIQKSEFQAGEEIFRDWDRNRDDQLSVREVRAYLRAQLEEAKKRPTPANFFDLFDRNRDDRVTKREYDGPAEFFRRYDHDRDRVVTREEMDMGADPGAMRPGDADLQADGPTPEPRRGLLERYDEDGDGRVTLEELKGAETILRRLDRNRDGVLSGAELR